MSSATAAIAERLRRSRRLTVAGAPDGLIPLFLGDFARDLHETAHETATLIHIAHDDQSMAQIAAGMQFFAPDVSVLRFPAWDCLPYDRVGVNPEISATRIATLAALARPDTNEGPRVVLTTLNAIIQRVIEPETVLAGTWSAAPGSEISLDELKEYLTQNGYVAAGTVREPGEYAVRGGIVDLFAPGNVHPVRLDLFGKTLESIRSFDARTQRTVSRLSRIDLLPAGEVSLSDASIRRFRSGYVARFGPPGSDDPLYDAISAGRPYQGMEHWLALFHDRLCMLFDYAGDWIVALDPLVQDARHSRMEQITDYYEARTSGSGASTASAAPPYKALPPEALTAGTQEWDALMNRYRVLELTPFEMPRSGRTGAVTLGARAARRFAAERKHETGNLFDAVGAHIGALSGRGRRVVLACWSEGSRERLSGLLDDHGVGPMRPADTWPDAQGFAPGTVALAILGLEGGFETPDLAVISEQDILGERLVRKARGRRTNADFIADVSALSLGDLVVHIDHGIGRYQGLRAIDVQGAPHDCLLIVYHGDDKLFLPVENIELLSRYGAEQTAVPLDRLGGAAWQARKSRLKERIREIARRFISTAAARELRSGVIMEPPEGIYDEFCARFAYHETEDQARAIDDVIADLGSGRPMDRLICGDVGFGKTEVALRSSFITAMSGRQVAIVVPTTLLARQHFATFAERFRGFPVKIAQASRLVPASALARTREGLKSGEVDIVIGTHALLAKSVSFRDLGLLIVDEEQHFGVAHKERLKELKTNVHVLTLSATPIPRTLQLALSGVREMSLITTPPVDRLSVRTFVTPFDPIILREALLREHYRGGQTFYVCPRIRDLSDAEQILRDHVPEISFRVAHGQMPGERLEAIMTGFYDREFDVLLSTSIVESGLDIPTANTLIVHRADRFGLSQLYQLRGRVGRSKTRAYALFTTKAGRPLTPGAEKRLRVLQSLDHLGAGFSLASHDLDIRGAGNLLGDEQSGHIKEVGLALYQDMLEEMVASLREGDAGTGEEEPWSPQINIGTPVLIPESYVADLDLRLSLYRRLARLDRKQDIEAFAAELIDRFGPLPGEVGHLLEIVAIKALCRQAGVSQIDAGAKGAVIGFHNDEFADPEGLIAYVTSQAGTISLRPDHKLIYRRGWPSSQERIQGVQMLLRRLAAIAKGEGKAA